MARVNVEQKAFTDSRFVILGKLIGTDRWGAIGRMTLIWNECQERGTNTLSEDAIAALHDDVTGFVLALVKSELATMKGAQVYIKGSSERVHWLEKKRDIGRRNGTKGGRPRGTNKGLPAETPPAPAPTPTKNTSLRFEEDSREMRAAHYLFAKIQENNPAAKEPNWQSWAEEFDRILRIDKRDHVHVREVIDFVQADNIPRNGGFCWAVNVMSPSTLRGKYDRLAAEMVARGKTGLEKKDAIRPEGRKGLVI